MVNKSFFRISFENLAKFSFVVYFANPFFISFFSLFKIPNTVSVLLTLLMIYVPLFTLFFLDSKKYLKADFAILYIFLILFFGITWLFHPEYTPYYLKREYGVWDTVFFPTHGIYTYLFVRLMDTPEKILKNVKISGYLMFFYFLNEIYLYTQRGFWYGVAGNNGQAKMGYSVLFGYQVLFFLITFLYCSFKYKKKSEMAITLGFFIMLFIGGSRGPVIFIVAFVIIYWILEFLKHNKFLKYKKRIMGFFISSYILYYFKNNILIFISRQLNLVGFSSRFVDKLLHGTISSDSGRSVIWEKTVEMIKQNPFGYGGMGSRHFLTEIIFAGYPHSFVLEILADFGIFFGGMILILFLINTLIMLFDKKREEWRGVFLIFLSSSFCLFLSLSYWNNNTFWGTIGIVMNCWLHLRKKRDYRSFSLKLGD